MKPKSSLENHKLEDKNSKSSLYNVEFIEKHLLHSIFHNPVTNKGSNGRVLARASKPEGVRMMFGTSIDCDGQPEYFCSPLIKDCLSGQQPEYFCSPLIKDCLSGRSSGQAISNSNTNSLNIPKTESTNTESVNCNCSSFTPKSSDSNFDLEEFIKIQQSDEDKIKTEIEKIFEPFSEANAESMDKKEIVGQILKNLVSKFGLLRIYTTLKMVEDELQLQYKNQVTAHNQNYLQITEMKNNERVIGKCNITAVGLPSNDSLMKQKSAEIMMDALFLKNNVQNFPGIISATSVEKEKEIIHEDPTSDCVGHISTCWRKDGTVTDEGVLKISLVPLREQAKPTTNSNCNQEKNQMSQNFKGNMSTKARNEHSLSTPVDNEGACLGEKSSSFSKEYRGSAIKKKSSNQTDKFNSLSESEWKNWSKPSTGLTKRAKLALLKKRINGKTKKEKLAGELNRTHLVDKVQQSRMKLRERNYAYLKSRSDLETTTLFVAAKNSVTSQDTGIEGLKTIYKDDCTSNFNFEEDKNSHSFSSGSKSLIDGDESGVCDSTLKSCIRSRSKTSETIAVASPTKWSRNNFFVTIIMLLLAITTVGYIFYTEKGLSLNITRSVY